MNYNIIKKEHVVMEAQCWFCPVCLSDDSHDPKKEECLQADLFTRVGQLINSREVMINTLDEHIRQWREGRDNPTSERNKQRAIDAIDALQQLRLAVYGELFKNESGSYLVSVDHGETIQAVETQEEATALYSQANKT